MNDDDVYNSRFDTSFRYMYPSIILTSTPQRENSFYKLYIESELFASNERRINV